MRASEEVGTVDLLEALAGALADVQAARSAALMAGRATEVVRAATATVTVVSALADRLGLDSDEVASTVRESWELAHAVRDVIGVRPEVGGLLAQALRRHNSTDMAEALDRLAVKARDYQQQTMEATA